MVCLITPSLYGWGDLARKAQLLAKRYKKAGGGYK